MRNIARTLVGRRREQLASALVLAVGVFVVLAYFAASSPALGDNKTVARFKWSLSGSMQHDWTVASSDPCGVVGPGRITATFKAKGKGAFKVFRNPRGHFFDYNPQVTLKGTVTESDDTHQNPNDIPSPCNPTDKSKCGTRQIESSFGFLQDFVGNGKHFEFQATGVSHAFGSGDCAVGNFSDFGRVNGRDLAKLYVALPKPAKMARKRKAFSLSAQLGDSGQQRAVTVKFTPKR